MDTLGVLTSVMKDLADMDYVQLPVEIQAQVLRVMEQVAAGQAAVRGRAGWAFAAMCGFDDYAQKYLGRWYITQTRVSKPAGYAHKAWARRYEQHPAIIAALAELDLITESWARQVTQWTSKLPEEYVRQADELMVQAARQGVDLEGLAWIAAELHARLCGPDEDKNRLPERGVTLEGAGVINGDLTPACTAKVAAVLGALSEPAGPDDLRSHSGCMTHWRPRWTGCSPPGCCRSGPACRSPPWSTSGSRTCGRCTARPRWRIAGSRSCERGGPRSVPPLTCSPVMAASGSKVRRRRG
jgi:hypothetical protein